jgi:pantetheine-phosphate adenylyltransferase
VILQNKVPRAVIRKLEEVHFKKILRIDNTYFDYLFSWEDFVNKLSRPYHNLHHSYDIFDYVVYKSEQDFDKEEKDAIAWAAAVHDIEYSEEESFRFFYNAMVPLFEGSPPSGLIKRVEELVLATDHSKPLSQEQLEDDTLCRFVAADLMILASFPEEYSEYVKNIREEYSHLTDAEWKEGRRKFIESMLKPQRECIFPDNGMFKEQERIAVYNLQYEWQKYIK